MVKKVSKKEGKESVVPLVWGHRVGRRDLPDMLEYPPIFLKTSLQIFQTSRNCKYYLNYFVFLPIRPS